MLIAKNNVLLVITGAPGCGKSALLANFARAYDATSDMFVLPHFIGVSRARLIFGERSSVCAVNLRSVLGLLTKFLKIMKTARCVSKIPGTGCF